MPDPDFIARFDSPEEQRAFAAWMLTHQEDGLWARSDVEILKRYAGKVVVLHERQVIGSGRDHLEAVQDAERQVRAMPPGPEYMLILIPETPFLDEEFLFSAAHLG